MANGDRNSFLETLRMFANWRMGLIFLVIFGCAALVLIYPDLVTDFAAYRQGRREAYLPPRYQGSWIAYSTALFSMFTISSLSIHALWQMALEYRANLWPTDPDISLYRYAWGCVLVTFFVGISPDVMELLAYGEVSLASMATLQTVDRLGDSLILPFALFAFFLVARAEQLHRIEETNASANKALLDEIEKSGRLPEAHKPPRRAALFSCSPRGENIANYWRIVAIVLVIAVGIATLK